MPIINQFVSGGGTGPVHYIEKNVDANGKLINGSTSINLTGVTDIGDYVLYYAYFKNTSVTGTFNFPVSSITGQYACSNFFRQSNISSVNAGNLTTINATSTLEWAFKECNNLTTVNLSSLTTVNGNSACYEMFSKCNNLTTADLSSLTSINGSSSCYAMFADCTNLINVNLDSLETIEGSSSFSNFFQNCTKLTKFRFNSLRTITNGGTMASVFENCSKLKLLSFPVLSTVNGGSGTLSNMLKNVIGCTVTFPPELESVISGWDSVRNGFGGVGTRVVFNDAKIISVSIPQGYKVLFNDEDITNSTEVIAILGNNNVEGIDPSGRAFKYNFVADSTTTSFTPDVSSLTFNEFQLTSNETGVVFSASVPAGSLTVDANDKVYSTAGLTLTAFGTKQGFISFGDSISTDTSATLTVTMYAGQEVVIDSSNVATMATGDTNYLSVDTTENLIKFGDTAYINAASVQITLTPPSGTTNMKIVTAAYSQTEQNYDWSFISLGTARVTPSRTDIQNGTIANGSYLFRQTGVNTNFVSIDTGTIDQTNLVLSFGMAEDNYLSGDNTLRIKPITVYFW